MSPVRDRTGTVVGMAVPPSPSARRTHWWLLRTEADGTELDELRVPAHPTWDHALRVDLVDGLLVRALARGVLAPTVVLTRPGTAWTHDLDLVWRAATAEAQRGHAMTLSFEVETAQGRHRPC